MLCRNRRDHDVGEEDVSPADVPVTKRGKTRSAGTSIRTEEGTT